MKKLSKLLIVAAILYAIIAFITWDMAWVTINWFFRTTYLILTMIFTSLLIQWEEQKHLNNVG